MDNENLIAFDNFVELEKLNSDKLKRLIKDYLFSQRTSSKHGAIETLVIQPSVLNRSTIGETLITKFMNFVNTFLMIKTIILSIKS